MAIYPGAITAESPTAEPELALAQLLPPDVRMTSQELRERTLVFALAVFKFVRPLFRSSETRNIAQQLLDAATSVAANYRAAGHARSPKEWRAKLGVVVEEADESAFWLLFIQRAGLGEGAREALGSLLDEAQQLTRIFGAALSTSRNLSKS